MSPKLLQGKDHVRFEDIIYLLVPGRGRAGMGDKLTNVALERARFAAKLYKELDLAARGGLIITSGYKSPADNLGVSHVFQQGYGGIPEAELLKRELVANGVPETSIVTENDSIDTVTNLANVEFGDYFPDDKPVAIVAQTAHLHRIIYHIAPRILQRRYVGVIVPDTITATDRDTLLARLATWMIVRGVSTQSDNIKNTVQKRASIVWKIARVLPAAKNYHVEKPKE